jgi:murein DD-endopeptidase MepM/ murein hydrolase activator NlpD
MAKMMVRNPGPRKPKSAFSRTWLGRVAENFSQRIFCKRSIIIIADHKTHHVPFAGWVQFVGVVASLGVVIWASYSSGSYVAAQKVLIEKDRKIASSTLENQRVEAEFSLLRRDLMKLAEESKNGKSGEYAKVIAEQYAHENTNQDDTKIASKDEDSDKYNAVFKRIEYLENKVKDLQSTHDSMMTDIRSTTGGKIKELEKVIARTGMESKPLERSAEAKRNQEEQRKEKYGRIEGKEGKDSGDNSGKGGPYEPLPSSVLKEKDTDLYFNLRRLMALNDIVNAMPLDVPIAGNKWQKSSGFGTRIDPFRGVLAFHSGLDFSGPEGSKILATNNGRVEFAGWKSAYGNVIDIRHEYGISTRYAHLSRVLVQPDQIVRKGQVIGIQGSTGRSTGHHLHYEVRYNGKALNPSNFVKAGDDVREIE